MRKEWSDEAWEDYLYWQSLDKKTLKKINDLIKDIDQNGLQGIGKSEPLKYRPGWSRRIDKANRLVFASPRAREAGGRELWGLRPHAHSLQICWRLNSYSFLR